MSSEIYYNRGYIRVGTRYVPVVNHGSTNCYQFDRLGREIPERHWSVLRHPSRKGMLFTEGVALDKRFQRVFKRYAAKLETLAKDNIVPHVLRHTFCTDRQIDGVSLVSVAYTMGHSKISTTDRYTHPEESRAEKEFKKVYELQKSS